MPIIDYTIPCMLSSIDQRTNSVSLFSVIETIEIVEDPKAQHGSMSSLFTMEVVTLWRRRNDEVVNQNYEQVITLRHPDDQEVELSRTEFRLPHSRSRTHVRLEPVELRQSGEYTLVVYLGSIGDSVFAEYPIYVEITRLDIVINLNQEEIALFEKPINGQGGFQSFLRRLQRQIIQNRLVLTVPDAERIINYVERYGPGGFQSRSKRIVGEIQRQLPERSGLQDI